jgi:hypothetical protein
VPLGTLLATLGAGLSLRALLQLWDLIVWTYHQFWGGD